MGFDLGTNFGDDVIYISDIIERVEWLEDVREEAILQWKDHLIDTSEPETVPPGEVDKLETLDYGRWLQIEPDAAKELDLLKGFLDTLRGQANVIAWDNSCFPEILIREGHLPEYIKEGSEEIIELLKNRKAWLGAPDWNCVIERRKRDGYYKDSALESMEGERIVYYYKA